MKQMTPSPLSGWASKTFHVAHRQKYTYRLLSTYSARPLPGSRKAVKGGVAHWAVFGAPSSMNPPEPFARSRYGGLPRTTTPGSSAFILLAWRRETAMGSRVAARRACSANGLSRVSAT
ncbi:hypothetical protein [Blastococcus mobilis]|uniref:Uncharacterized protein n=1 Tax=Blastococcus mobilis TaxID=1938746 RepID=A0A238ZJS1_9ACTN|nr:hypothetical protein [Blastococcus mobilis]SNR83228.1 hypothetical protein SAMN06272737_12935 [Blastococcus mobilis]